MSTVLITGGHAGIGLEAANHLAEHGLNLILAGRDARQVESVAQQLGSRHGINATTLTLDLSSLASVQGAAARVRAMLLSGAVDSLQAIVCNAGAQFQGAISYSVDGYEKTFATNYLGHFALVSQLLDCVSENGRIVFTSSGTHDPQTMDGKMVGAAVEPDARALALDGKNGVKPISGGQHYTTSKLCMILYAYELSRRLGAAHSSVSSIAFCPGFIPETGLTRTSPKPIQMFIRTVPAKWLMKRLGVTMGSVSFSGAALATVVASATYANSSGKYFQSHNGTLIEAQSSEISYDAKRAAKLWNDSLDLIRQFVLENRIPLLEQVHLSTGLAA